ncbi:hypothetical protein BWI93_24055 [Siphonobacter sp. BAB-5385]|nr:hypothetical protein BWI93_24055 [Siphonobacter sp. BAB-5385]
MIINHLQRSKIDIKVKFKRNNKSFDRFENKKEDRVLFINHLKSVLSIKIQCYKRRILFDIFFEGYRTRVMIALCNCKYIRNYSF